MTKSQLFVGAVGTATLTNVGPALYLMSTLNRVEGDCIGRALGQLVIMVGVASLGMNLGMGWPVFCILKRWLGAPADSLLWACTATTAGPLLLAVLVVRHPV